MRRALTFFGTSPLLAILLIAGLAATPAEAGLFGSTEVRRASLTPFTKWTDMLARDRRADGDQQTAPGPLGRSGACRPDSPIGCARPDWEAIVATLRGGDRMAQLRAVNAAMNRYRYITDPENWGVPDYWATPRQFLRRDGDCEDYAIAKYMALKTLGFPAAAMRIVIVQDLNLGVPHAVLSVDLDGRELILDNQIQDVLPDTAIVHYRPIYSINETAWWLHQPRS